ncbi:hypothetical protein AHAS_Ahas05G0227900 [Arachis hypogaea]
MAGGIAAIADMKKRLSSQPPINVSSDRISSSATISYQSQSQRVEKHREGKVEELELSIKKAEQMAADGIFYAKRNILDQIKLKAPDLDVSKVDAFKKVMDGNFVSIL